MRGTFCFALSALLFAMRVQGQAPFQFREDSLLELRIATERSGEEYTAPAPEPVRLGLCESPRTPDIVECLEKQRDESKADLVRYLAEIRRLNADRKSDLKALEAAQLAWSRFVKADCRANYEHSIDGSIRDVMFVGCEADHTKSRVHQIWETYLRGMVTSLPEPPA